MTKKEKIRKGKLLALVLRHKPETLNLTLDKNGWANIKDIIKNSNISQKELIEIVETNNKQRFEFSKNMTKIRARQGHSINVDVELKKQIPTQSLFHGTSNQRIDSILKNGLQKQERLFVHLTEDQDLAIKSGKRHGGEAVLIEITCEQIMEMLRDNFIFYLSNNNVWLVDNIPPKYIKVHFLH